MGRALARVPIWAWLAAIVAASAATRALLARDLVAPFIIVDEIVWSELARGIASAGEPLIRDQSDPGYSVVYPLLISPAYALFDSLPHAYAAVKTENAVLMSLAAVPAFLLARRVVSERLALLAAVLAVALPSLAYTGTVMTENAFYPLFLVVALMLAVVLERPRPVPTIVLLALLVLAFATRVQAVALAPAVLLAPALLALFRGRGARETISRFRWLYGLAATGAAGVLVVSLAAGHAPQDLLGAYQPVGERSYAIGEALRYLWWHLAELALYVLVVPLAATIVLVGRARSLDARLQELLAATVALVVCVVPFVAVFASEFSDRIEERNTFYVAPLLCIALLAWVERDAPRPRVLAAIAAAVSALLVAAIPFDRFLTTSAITDTLMLLPFWSLQDRIGEDWTRPAAIALAVVLAASFLFVPRRLALVLPLVILGLWVGAARPIWWGTHGFERFSRGALFQGIRSEDRDWVDRLVPSGAQVAFLWTGRGDRLTVSQNEFFNRAIGPVYYLSTPTPGGLPETRVRIDPESGDVTLPDGSPVTDRFLLAGPSFQPDGKAVAEDEELGVTLWLVAPPLVAVARVDGLYPDDSWSTPEVDYLRRRCRPGRLEVELSSDDNLFLEPQTVVARASGVEIGRVRFRPDEQPVLRVPVRPEPGTSTCLVNFSVSPTAVPAQVTRGANPDRRELGAHFNRFTYTPSPR